MYSVDCNETVRSSHIVSCSHYVLGLLPNQITRRMRSQITTTYIAMSHPQTRRSCIVIDSVSQYQCQIKVLYSRSTLYHGSRGCMFSDGLISEACYRISPGLLCGRFSRHRYSNTLNITRQNIGHLSHLTVSRKNIHNHLKELPHTNSSSQIKLIQGSSCSVWVV